MTDLVIVGAGGFARETAAAVQAVNEAHASVGDSNAAAWDLLGFLDDDPALHGTQRAGVPVLGGPDSVSRYPDASVVVCVGNPRDYAARERVVDRLGLAPQRFATIVRPTASVGAGSVIGPGSVLLAHVALTAGVRVGSHVAVMPQVVLTHDDDVADFATIASGVRLGGGVRVRRGAYLGAGALVRESLTIGEWSLVGLGSVVLSDVPPGEVWVGSPAAFLRSAQPGPVGSMSR